MKNTEKQPILVVEDSPEDWLMIKKSFQKVNLANPLYHCDEGEEVLDYLFHRGAYKDPQTAPKPGLILLDLNLPGTDGHEVLREIKSDPELREIPVIVLTTSTDERDIKRSYENGANSYITKPVTFNGFTEAIQRLKDYWFSIVILPKEDER